MMRFALIGCGKIGKVHADSIAAHPRAELAWACHPREQAARTFAAEYGAEASADVDTVLADPSVDAILIASPTSTHVDLITRGVLAGKAALCEKPIDLDITRVDACWEQIKSENPTVMMGFNRRFDPSFRAVRDRIRAGEIGRLEQLIIISRDPAPPPPGYVAGSGGLFRDMTPEPGFADGRATLALADAAGESIRSGRVVHPGVSISLTASLSRPSWRSGRRRRG